MDCHVTTVSGSKCELTVIMLLSTKIFGKKKQKKVRRKKYDVFNYEKLIMEFPRM